MAIGSMSFVTARCWNKMGLDFAGLVKRMFLPGAIYTFVGAGGKSTAIRLVAGILSRAGARARMTTTTKIGIEEFSNYPISFVKTEDDLQIAVSGHEPVGLIVGSAFHDRGKYGGVDPSLFERLSVDSDTILLVEGDGSRRRPLKAPDDWEPVIPRATAMVVAMMGASGFGEPIDEDHCYNHEAALRILPAGARCFAASEVATLASHPAGCRKGVLPGMRYHVLMNQADLGDKRPIGSEALRILTFTHGIQGSLLSFQQEVVYETDIG